MRPVVTITAAVAVCVFGILYWLSGFLEMAAYEVLLGTIAVAALASLSAPATVALPAKTRRRTAEPPQLVRVERIVRFGTSTAIDADRRLYRMLQEQAGELLLGRYGVDLGSAEARRLLGDEAWSHVRPDRPLSVDRLGPGAELSEVEGVVDAIEQLLDR
jgi:hypothetical protein